ncbi:MAG TPA: prephenate dehydratase [Bryobacteraceae bacterium]|jgi:prephenate dehydratase|nr:prephenate dehydratase [Bryobacteraceae bacterium]
MPRSKYTVAFQGELGAFSHAAALHLLGPKISLLPEKTFQKVFDVLGRGEANCAVIPIENTLHGSVHENYDYLLDYNFSISGETSVRISHQLIAMPGVSFRSVRQVLSHPVALNQCKHFFERYKQLVPVPHYDTAGSVKSLREQHRPDAAAIASETAARTYGGTILKRNIEDLRQNFTRFFLLTKQPFTPPSATGEQKTSLVFSTTNTPGALFRALACFALRDLSLTKIESRPLRGKPWEYLFYVDFLGNLNEKTTQNAVSNLRECTQMVKLLGSYRPTP